MRYILSPISRFSFMTVLILLAGCYRGKEEDSIVSKSYVHKYGYGISKAEFEEKKYPSQAVTILKNGVTVAETYEGGVLHGPSTYTFPDSQTIEYYLLYNNGVLVKELLYNSNGMPIQEFTQLSPHVYKSIRWYDEGTPMSIEEYDISKVLVDGSYFNIRNELVSEVKGGEGVRIVYNPRGTIEKKEKIQKGLVTQRETFYANGFPETISFYSNGLLDGIRKVFSETGEPLSTKEYRRGRLDGKTSLYRNGALCVQIDYVEGAKEGLEVHYLDGGAISQEIFWNKDKKHGRCTYYTEKGPYVEYFHKGSKISEERWNELAFLSKIMNEDDLK